MRGRSFLWLVLAVLLLVTLSCTTYRSREVAFRHPSAYPGMQQVAGAQIAAESFAERGMAREAFGFDVRGAGLLPVQVVMDNTGAQPLTIVPEQTFLIDEEGGMWNLLDSRTAYQRVEQSSEYGRIAKGAGRGSLLGATGGALVGAAIGIVTGENVGTAAAKGAAAGGAGGAVLGGAGEMASPDAGRQISRDLANKELVNQAIEPGMLGRGFLFFPGEAPSAGTLRLQLQEGEGGQTHTLMLPLK
jgi:hypothetical protein